MDFSAAIKKVQERGVPCSDEPPKEMPTPVGDRSGEYSIPTDYCKAATANTTSPAATRAPKVTAATAVSDSLLSFPLLRSLLFLYCYFYSLP